MLAMKQTYYNDSSSCFVSDWYESCLGGGVFYNFFFFAYELLTFHFTLLFSQLIIIGGHLGIMLEQASHDHGMRMEYFVHIK